MDAWRISLWDQIRNKSIIADGPMRTKMLPYDRSTGASSAALAMRDHEFHDLIVAIESTGTYYRPVQDAFRGAGFERSLRLPARTDMIRLIVARDLPKKEENAHLHLQRCFGPRKIRVQSPGSSAFVDQLFGEHRQEERERCVTSSTSSVGWARS